MGVIRKTSSVLSGQPRRGGWEGESREEGGGEAEDGGRGSPGRAAPVVGQWASDPELRIKKKGKSYFYTLWELCKVVSQAWSGRGWDWRRGGGLWPEHKE